MSLIKEKHHKIILCLIFTFILVFPLEIVQFLIFSSHLSEFRNSDYLDLINTSQNTNEKMFDWNKTYGGEAFDRCSALATNSSNSTFLVGWTRSFGVGDEDTFLVCTDVNGTQQWSTTWGGTDSDYGEGIAIDSVGNVYVSGYTKSYSSVYNVFLTKYNSNGISQWNRTWGFDKNDWGYGVAVDSNDNIYVVGSTKSRGPGKTDLLVLKYNSTGYLEAEQYWGGTEDDFGYGICATSENRICVAGYTESYGNGERDICVIQYDSSLNKEWEKIWGGVSNEEASSIASDSLNNLYLTGHTTSYGSGGRDVVLIKYNKVGTLQWNRTWGGMTTDEGRGIDLDSTDNIYVVGTTNSYGAGLYDYLILKYNKLGDHLWNKTNGGVLNDEGFEISVKISNNIFVSGFTENYGAGAEDMSLLRYGVDTDGDGLSDWQEINIYSTDPTNIDSDGDGFSDKAEILSGHDPNNALSSPLIDIIVWIVIIAISAAAVVVIVIIVRRGAEGRAERRAQRARERERAEETISDRRRADQAREERERIKREREERERIEKEQLDQEKREKEQQLQNVIELIDKLIQEYDFASAISGLNDIIEMAEAYDLTRVIKWAKKNKKYCETFESVLNLLRISRRSKIDDLASIMEVERSELLKRLIKSAQEVQFVIDGEYIELDPKYFGSFVKMLEGHYKELLDQEKILEKGPELEEHKVACIVCKGEIMAFAYNCPNCTAVYHLKCAHSLKDADDKCWQCGTPFPALPRPVEDEGIITKEVEKSEKKKEKKKKKKKKKKE